MNKQQRQYGEVSHAKPAKVISLAEYRGKQEPASAPGSAGVSVTIENGEVVTTAAHVTPEDVPAIVAAMARLASDLMLFLDSAKTASLSVAIVASLVYADSVLWPAYAQPAPIAISQAGGDTNNMHKWLAYEPGMHYHSSQAGQR